MDFIQFDPGAPRLPDRRWSKYEAQACDLVSLQSSVAIVEGLWRKGEVLLLGGHSKSWKSWALMDLMFCVANGFAWLAWDCVLKGPVLHIDLELFASEIGHRYQAIRQAYGTGSLDNITVWSLRGQNFTLNDFRGLASEIESHKYVAISFDPTYRMLAGSNLNESDPSVITDLMNNALSVASNLGCGIDLLQHFSKGSQSNKRAIDAFSGSGVWGRAADTCLTFREHQDERCYTVSADLRHWPNIEPFVVEFVHPRFKIRSDKDPENLKTFKPNGRPVSFSIEALCNLIEGNENISYTNLKRRCQAAGVKSESTFKRRLREAKDKGWLAISPIDQTYLLTTFYVSKFRANGQNDH